MPRPTPTRAGRIAAHLVAAAVVGVLIWLLFGRTAFVNYDSAWSLNWMRELTWGQRPDLTRLFSPTPHPLSDLFSGLLAPLSAADGANGAVGTSAESVVIAFALFWLGALGVVTYRIGQAWFGVTAGVIAAVLVLTREPVLSYGLRTYLDLPYAVFLLLALLAETQRPRNGLRTMLWLTLAGLLRPEAWLLAAVYVGYLAVVQIRSRSDTASWWNRIDWRALALPIGVALIAPLGWIVEGLVLSGDPLQALTGTRENAADLDRVTGIGSAVTVMPRRLGEIVREPVLLAALGGIVLSLLFLRRRATLGIGAGIAAGAGFFALAAAGLPLLTRYLVFPATLLIVFAAAGLVGWRRLPADHRWRRPWQAFAAVALLAFMVFLPSQADRLDRLQRSLSLQQTVIGDLRTVVGEDVRPALATRPCAGRSVASPDVALPNHRAIPQVLLWLGRDPRTDRSPTVGALVPGAQPTITLLPSSTRVANGFILDAADKGRPLPAPPAGSMLATNADSWLVYAGSTACADTLRAPSRDASR